jgi:glycosyltransferase involved in cell wall biosynthesis
VGRFFAGAHNKKHMEMIRAFREMVDAGLREWELYLVGGSRTGDVHQKYLGDVITAAKGYPIHVLPDLPYSSLVPLYNESSIYWHASGYGEDENRDPVKSEHFGITTVEAMAAGCVPVVIAKGGQPEIVQHGKNGYLWNNLEELKSYTNKLISDANLCQNLSASAVNDSRRYSVENFHSNLLSLLDNIGIQNR